MSDTDNQENLSVEDILSSIKNILVDEEENEKEGKPEEDVLTLDNSMIIDNSVSSENIDTMLNSITEPITEEEEKDAKENLSLADSIDIEKTLDIADQIDLKDIPALDNLMNDDTPATSENGISEETIDASANIINNFAKVFAEKRHSQQASDLSSTLTKEIGQNIENTGISQMVKETIIQQVKLNLDSHFEQIASKIIAEQTQQWLNTNLANIVEKTVAKGIERVIAKVGS